jgi:NAD-dependent DNA ligase
LTKIGTLNKSVSELYKDINITLNIPDSVTTICQHSLSFTKTIKKVTGMKNVTQIGEAAFSNSSLEEIIWPDKCEEVKNGVFLSCNLKKFSGGQSIKDIDRFAFNYCKADYVDLSDTSIISADINALFVRNGGSVSNIKLPSFMQWEMDEDIRTQLTSGYELDKDGTLKRKTSGAIGGIVGGIAGNEFVITGTLSMVRADFEREIISRGGFVSNRVSRSTTYLIVGAKPGATKLNAGKKYGIPQVTENDVRKAF